MARHADEARWARFMAATGGQPPWPRLVRAADMLASPGDALDVGAGAGRDTAHLLSRGWRVTAVDSSPSSASALARLTQPGLTVATAAFEDFAPSEYDLVNAQFSLPFIPRDRFEVTVARLRDSVRAGGVMAATFFGQHDAWNEPGSVLNFSTRSDVERIFQGFELIELTEEEEDGHTADGSPKHWHVFHLIARRPR
ncbi:MAG TPA: class I SAM-dependent methyltransferase [Candidatus Sulfotelmatobacter sp.]|nr:class I SAM-dependent methyltransferase [Candidatus Sulfotelmatobacter sp.]